MMSTTTIRVAAITKGGDKVKRHHKRSRRPRPTIRRIVRLDLADNVADELERIAHTCGISVSELVARFLRRSIAQVQAEAATDLRHTRPIAVVSLRWASRRARQLLDVVRRTNRPVFVRGSTSPTLPASEIRGRAYGIDPVRPRFALATVIAPVKPAEAKKRVRIRGGRSGGRVT